MTEAGTDAFERPTTGARRGRRAAHSTSDAARFRVVFVGPMGVGKTTAVGALTDVAAVGTEVPITGGGDPATGKTTTTVGIDYGVWKPSTDLSIALVGTPGQDRFAAVRTSLIAPWTRVILWLYGDDPDLRAHARDWLDAIGAKPSMRLAVAITRTDDIAAARTLVEPILRESGLVDALVLAADPRDRGSVMNAVSAALGLPEEAQQR